jgi:hypothetical protein
MPHLNLQARGRARQGDQSLPDAVTEGAAPRTFFAALHNTTAITFMPVHMWGNSYT